MKAQLYAKNTLNETVLLQLSEDFPINMNLSVQDQNPFTTNSFYSQTFRIPGQGANGKFFEDVYSVNGATFNAGKAAEAWILADGFLFSIGNLNLVNVFTNDYNGTIEYEVFFMGDTSNFATSVGDGFMDTIDTSELNHDLTYSAITTSWGATAGATAGLKDGNVLYPLCEWGYEYDSSNYPTQSTISVGYPKGSTGPKGGSFTNGATSGLSLTQFKPAVRVKWLWDKIFSDAGYTYNSDFINSDLFDKLYMISDSVSRTEQEIQAGLCKMTANDFNLFVGQQERVRYSNTITNPDRSFEPVTSTWISPATGTFSFTISGYCYFPIGNFGYPQGAFKVYVYKNGSTLINTPVVRLTQDPFTSSAPYTTFWQENLTEALIQGDRIHVEIQQMPYGNSSSVFGGNTFQCGDAPDFVVVSSFFPGQGTLKKIDFIKGITTMFNLVWEPSREEEKSFQIQPWVDWIEEGSQKNWTRLLDASTDTKLTPSFIGQPHILNFAGLDDSDLQNTEYQDEYKRNWLYREFNSGIKVIRDTGEVSVPFGGTPLESIPSKTATQYPDWVIPTLGKLLPGDPAQNQSGKVQPIQPKPRILFYNGLQSNPIPWYLDNDAVGPTGTAQNQYPLVSEFSSFPPDNFTELVLNFQSKRALWSNQSTFVQQSQNDLYVKYWQKYVEWIYNVYNRRLTATFRLDPYDVQGLKFNDKVWVKDSWFFVERINNYPVGEVALVEVDLIKVPDSITPPGVVPATGGTGGVCYSVAVCNNEPDLEFAPVSWTYVDCNFQLQSMTLYPSTCQSVCALYPNPNALPANWTAIPNGNCVDGIYATAGSFVQVGLTAGNSLADGKVTTALLSGSTGGTAGTFIPMQYFTVTGEDSISVLYNVPFGYGAKMDLIFANGVSGATMFSETITLRKDGVIAATAARSTPQTYQPISATWPAGITGGNYTAELILIY